MSAIDISETVIVVTGANSGIGLATARGLAERGARVVATSRDLDRGQAAVEDIRASTGVTVDLVQLDLASFASIRTAAQKILDDYDRLDVLVNNAGIASGGMRWETAEGYEAVFGVNHLGPFLLTSLLLDRLVASAPSRIVMVSSGAYRMAGNGICFDDLQHEHDFHASIYGESKLANIYMTQVLAERLAGTGVTVNALNPGYVATGLGQVRPEDAAIGTAKPRDEAMAAKMLTTLPPAMTTDAGAEPSIRLATDPELATVTGNYFNRDELVDLTGPAADHDAALRLWDVSEQLIAAADSH